MDIEEFIKSRKYRKVELEKLLAKHEENNEKIGLINFIRGQLSEVDNIINQLECIQRFGCSLEDLQRQNER